MRAQPAEVEALVAAARDQHHVLEPGQRTRGGVGVGGLRVVVVTHAAALAHELHAVGQPAEAVEGARHRVDVGAHGERGGGGRERVGDVVRRTRRGHRGEHAGRPDQVGAHHAVVTGRGQSGTEAHHLRPARRPRASSATGSSRLTTSTPGRALVAEELGLGLRVRVDRSVPVEVVLGHVEQHRDVGRERVGGERELERRHLGDHDLDVVAGGVEQRTADVAGGDAGDAGLAEHGVDQAW